MSVYGAIFIFGFDSDKAYGNYIFIEQGGGKVASAVVVQDVANPENYQFYAFHSKDKLDKMMTEIIKDGKPAVTKHGQEFLKKYSNSWYMIPEKALKEL